MSKNRILRFNYSSYTFKPVKQINKHSDLDTVGSVDISTQINSMISRGELDKFLKEQMYNNIRNVSDVTDEDISILNIKHLDKYEVNTQYNKLRANITRTVNNYLARKQAEQSTTTTTDSNTTDSSK